MKGVLAAAVHGCPAGFLLMFLFKLFVLLPPCEVRTSDYRLLEGADVKVELYP